MTIATPFYRELHRLFGSATSEGDLIAALSPASAISMISAVMIVGSMLLVTSMAMAGAPSTSAATKATEEPHVAASSSFGEATISTPASGTTTSPEESNAQNAPYTVNEGNKVDAKTLAGWKTWRALACERCHGAAQEGLVGPALVDSLKRLTKEEFHTTIMNGRLEKGMPSFSSSKMVTDNWEGLYAYLKGRSDGQIQPGHLSLLDEESSPKNQRIESSVGQRGE